MESCPKMRFFLGNSMTIKFGDSANFIVRNFVVIWEAATAKGLREREQNLPPKPSGSLPRLS